MAAFERVAPATAQRQGRMWVVGAGACMALLAMVAVVRSPGVTSAAQRSSDTGAILQRARALKAAGLHANGYAVDKSLRTARLRTHGARVTMLDEEEDIDAPTEEDRAAQMSNIDDPGPDITLGVPVHNSHYCFEDREGGEVDGGYGDGCSTETMATANGADYTKPLPTIREEDAPVEAPPDTPDVAATGDADEPDENDAMITGGTSGPCDGYDELTIEWLDCQAEAYGDFERR